MKEIGFIGAGNMGGALIAAACKGIGPQNVLITDWDTEKALELAGTVHCTVAEDNAALVRSVSYITLGVKPQVLPAVLDEIGPVLAECIAQGQRKVLVSMAAGVTVETIKSRLPVEIPVIRIMPNLPASIGKGMILLTSDCRNEADVSDAQFERYMEIMHAAGRFDRIRESEMDAATVAAGCTPAYAYLFIEALADGAVLCGTPRAKAMEYCAQALLGAASMILEGKGHPGALKDAVCSPGGSTIEGVAALESAGFRGAAIQAMRDAFIKNQAMGKAARDRK